MLEKVSRTRSLTGFEFSRTFSQLRSTEESARKFKSRKNMLETYSNIFFTLIPVTSHLEPINRELGGTTENCIPKLFSQLLAKAWKEARSPAILLPNNISYLFKPLWINFGRITSALLIMDWI